MFTGALRDWLLLLHLQLTYRERLQALLDDEALNEVRKDLGCKYPVRAPWEAGWGGGRLAGASYRGRQDGRR